MNKSLVGKPDKSTFKIMVNRRHSDCRYSLVSITSHLQFEKHKFSVH